MSIGFSIVLIFIIAILGGGCYFLLRLKHQQTAVEKAEPTLGDGHLTNEFSAPAMHGTITTRANPIIGDPTLAELGFGNIDPIGKKIFGRSVEPIAQTEPETAKIVEPPKVTQKPFLIALNIISKGDQLFLGYELLQSLLTANLRYGAMSIFHRHEKPHGQGRVIFSVASATEPGTFDLAKIGAVACTGLCLFMNLAESQDPTRDFDLMLSTTKQLAEDLDGAVCDDKQQPLTRSTIEQYRWQIFQYQRSQLEVDTIS